MRGGICAEKDVTVGSDLTRKDDEEAECCQESGRCKEVSEETWLAMKVEYEEKRCEKTECEGDVSVGHGFCEFGEEDFAEEDAV